MSRYYEITDGNIHVGWASEDYMFTKMDERVLKGEANFNIHVGDRDAVDVVPVVRCKDCHWRTGLEEHTAWHPCDEMAVNDNWFCADGERRDDVSDICVGEMEEEDEI